MKEDSVKHYYIAPEVIISKGPICFSSNFEFVNGGHYFCLPFIKFNTIGSYVGLLQLYNANNEGNTLLFSSVTLHCVRMSSSE